MAKKKKVDGFNLAFLDVMACGLGAVLMILIVLKFNANTSIPTDEVEKLSLELSVLEDDAKATSTQNLSAQQALVAEQQASDELEQQIAQLLLQQQATQSAIDKQKAVIADLEQAIAAAAPKQSDDPIEIQGSGEEKYLLGLKMEGERIGILLDVSASMTAESLIDIFKRKVQSDTVKKQGPKWLRAQRILRWMLARLPKNSEVSVVAFSDKASALGKVGYTRISDTQGLATILGDAQKLVPDGGTNLQLGLQEISKQANDLTTLYLITDGLPTQLTAGSGFNNERNCKPSDRSQKTITGACRLKVFAHTFSRFAPRVKTHIVLLPLEGDSQAPVAYWNWANSTAGLMINPARTWP